jgi:phenylacetic acid degradation operon negative regulatory protein
VKVLPSDWNGVAAARTFFELRDKLAGPAHRLVDTIRAG